MADTLCSIEIPLHKAEFGLFRDLIFKETGIVLRDSKQVMLASRLHKRLRHYGLGKYREYYDYLMTQDADGSERLRMINCVTTNKTEFFREEHHFDYLRDTLLPMLEQQGRESGKRRLRIWSAACSTGEEPYTIAMVVRDFFSRSPGWDIRILASDIDTDVLDFAQKGVYDEVRASSVGPERLRRCFNKIKTGKDVAFEVRSEFRDLIAFRRINFMDASWPINTEFDLIFCRNVMIYFDDKTQDHLVTRFADYLKPEGHLFIGHSESILRLDSLYAPLGHTIYQAKLERPRQRTLAVGAMRKCVQEPDNTNRSSSISTLASTRPFNRPALTNPTQALSRSPRPSQSDPTAVDNRPRKSIIVGEVLACAEPTTLTTLVGSCIAVCLYDPVTRVGGMNHFMLPGDTSDGRVCASYGMHAMELLVNEMMKRGASRFRLVAKIFGGGNVVRSLESGSKIGNRNVEFALDYLDTEKIPVLAKHVGGEQGRHVKLLTDTGAVSIRCVERTRDIDTETALPIRVVGETLIAPEDQITLF